MDSIHISLAAEEIFRLGPLPVTNSLLTTWFVLIFLIVLTLIVNSRLKMVPSNLQIFAEMMVGGLHSLFEQILHEKNNKYFPYLATIFIFIIFQNWAGLLPGVGTIGLYKTEEHAGANTVLAVSDENIKTQAQQESEFRFVNEDSQNGASEEKPPAFVPLFRSGTADLNTTLALALVTIAYIQFAGLKTLGASYLKKFFNFSNPIFTFVGILEMISEVSRIISFAFRLFGNIFAGEVLLTVIAFLIPILAPVPFMGLELFVGFIQALVFSMLTGIFLSLATSKAEH